MVSCNYVEMLGEMSKYSENVRTIFGLAAAAAIMVACPARAENAFFQGATPPLYDAHPKKLVLSLGHVEPLTCRPRESGG
jgi:hypothetical protein